MAYGHIFGLPPQQAPAMIAGKLFSPFFNDLAIAMQMRLMQ